MKRTSIAVVCALFSWTATNALAQTGLYGSPEPISLTQSPVYPAPGNIAGNYNPGNVVQTTATVPTVSLASMQPAPAGSVAAMLNEPTPAAPQGSPSDLRQTSTPMKVGNTGDRIQRD